MSTILAFFKLLYRFCGDCRNIMWIRYCFINSHLLLQYHQFQIYSSDRQFLPK